MTISGDARDEYLVIMHSFLSLTLNDKDIIGSLVVLL